jgi:hypothetical protein
MGGNDLTRFTGITIEFYISEDPEIEIFPSQVWPVQIAHIGRMAIHGDLYQRCLSSTLMTLVD